jgi:phosphatidylserine/phosphatidylglycerophosphate/cardiolipin synthase-like enzyme
MPHERIDFATVDLAWRRQRASRAALVVDAADYFAVARQAMLKANRRIMLVGWDFDGRIELTADSNERLPDEPRTLGDFILWLVERTPTLEVFLLRWNIGALRTLFRGSTLLTVARWMAHPRIHTRLDAAYPPGASHHHKIVTIDDTLAFCGGIDMTSNRWDTVEHRDDDPRRRGPTGAPYGAWHDTIMAVDDAVAASLAELARERWTQAGGHALAPVQVASDCWPDGLPVQFRDVSVAISRSRPSNGVPPIYEVEAAFLSAIEQAERTIYAESQYFASRRIAEAMADRLAEPDGPEIVLVNPKSAHGWLEPIAMDTARARLVEFVHRADHEGRFRLYHPVTAGGQPIYVHAKVLIVDDRILHAGSANMNNRSLRLDTECDLTIDVRQPGNAAAGPMIATLRDTLLGEHLGVTPEAVRLAAEREGSLIGAIELLRSAGRSLRPLEMPPLNDVEKWLADNELLDPEGPEEMFKPLSHRGLLRRLGKRFHLPRPHRRPSPGARHARGTSLVSDREPPVR